MNPLFKDILSISFNLTDVLYTEEDRILREKQLKENKTPIIDKEIKYIIRDFAVGYYVPYLSSQNDFYKYKKTKSYMLCLITENPEKLAKNALSDIRIDYGFFRHRFFDEHFKKAEDLKLNIFDVMAKYTHIPLEYHVHITNNLKKIYPIKKEMKIILINQEKETTKGNITTIKHINEIKDLFI